MEGVTVNGHHQECRVTFGREDLILFEKIPVPTMRDDRKRSLHIIVREAY